jgi:hypothetical protein
MCGTRLLRISATNIGLNRFQQNRAVSGLMLIQRSARRLSTLRGEASTFLHHHGEADHLRRAVEVPERALYSPCYLSRMQPKHGLTMPKELRPRRLRQRQRAPLSPGPSTVTATQNSASTEQKAAQPTNLAAQTALQRARDRSAHNAATLVAATALNTAFDI